jgi:TRAP-type C4-dicarboxylate transport system permease small subunit
MGKLERIFRSLSKWCDYIARVALVSMMLMAVLNIISRSVWQSIPGTYEIVGYLGAVVLGFAMAYTGALDRYVDIALVTERLPKRTQSILAGIIGILSFCLFMLAAIYCIKLAIDLWQAGELSPTLRFPYYPLIGIVGFGCLLLSLVLLVKALMSFIQGVGK